MQLSAGRRTILLDFHHALSAMSTHGSVNYILVHYSHCLSVVISIRVYQEVSQT